MKYTRNNLLLLSLIIMIGFSLVVSCQAQKRGLTYSQVFEYAEPRILGQSPSIEDWLDNDHYLAWMPSGKYRKAKLMKTHVLSGESSTYVDFSKICEEYKKGMFFAPWDTHTSDYRGFILVIDNDLFYLSAKSESLRQLTRTKTEEKNPRFSPDGKKGCFSHPGIPTLLIIVVLFWLLITICFIYQPKANHCVN